VARDARVGYYQWIRAQGANYVAAQALEAARGHATDAKNAYDAGLVSRADLLRALSQVKSAELTVAHYNNLVAVATEQLRVAMGDPTSANYDIGENILTELPPLAVPPTVEAGYGEALEHRLEVKQLGESEASLREQASAARAGNYPRLDAQGNLIYANPNQRYIPLADLARDLGREPHPVLDTQQHLRRPSPSSRRRSPRRRGRRQARCAEKRPAPGSEPSHECAHRGHGFAFFRA